MADSEPQLTAAVEAINLTGDEGDLVFSNLSDDEVEEVGAKKSTEPSSSKATKTRAAKPAKDNIEKKLKPNTGKVIKRQRKLTSPVWKVFRILDEPDENGNLVCVCNKCGVKYIAESRHGTGNMLRHARSCKGHVYKDVGQFILKTGLDGSLKTQASTYNHEEFRELLAIAIAKHNLPLKFVEYEGIRNCFSYLNKEVKTISRNTIKSDIKDMYSLEKSKLVELLQLVPGRISLTSDCWTSVTSDGYISLTAHFIDVHWLLVKKLLAFTLMPPPHTGVALASKVYALLKEWGIHSKVVSITLDNASNNDVMVESLKFDLDLMCDGSYLHVRCCAHVLNIIVQIGLKELDESVKKVRECVKYCKGSQNRKNSFRSAVQHVGIESTKGLTQDVATRWNSTFLMPESALFFKKALVHMEKNDANFVHCPSPHEWSKIEKFSKFLRVFHEVTLVFSGSKYPTANLYFPNVLKIRLLLKEELESKDEFIKSMATKMHSKFDKYWSQFSTIMAIAVIFDPRYKYQMIDWAYKRIYGSNAELELGLFKAKLFSLFDEYVALDEKSKSEGSSSHSSSVDKTMSDTLMKDFDEFSSCEFPSVRKSEMESYLEEPKLPRVADLDVLDHWKSIQGRFPVVSQMARDILAIPISTVASESVFSVGGRVLDAYRSSLKADTAEVIVCLRDWVFNESSLQPEVEDLCKKVRTMKVEDEDGEKEGSDDE